MKLSRNIDLAKLNINNYKSIKKVFVLLLIVSIINLIVIFSLRTGTEKLGKAYANDNFGSIIEVDNQYPSFTAGAKIQYVNFDDEIPRIKNIENVKEISACSKYNNQNEDIVYEIKNYKVINEHPKYKSDGKTIEYNFEFNNERVVKKNCKALLTSMENIYDNFLTGRDFNPNDTNSCIISTHDADGLCLKYGFIYKELLNKNLTVTYNKNNNKVTKDIKIIGIVNNKFKKSVSKSLKTTYEYLLGDVYFSNDLENILKPDLNKITPSTIYIEANDINAIGNIEKEIGKIDKYWVRSYADFYVQIKEIFKGVSIFLIILTVVLCLCCFINFVTILMYIANKRKKLFAMQNILGFTNNDIVSNFIIEFLLILFKSIFYALVFGYTIVIVIDKFLRAVYSEVVSVSSFIFVPDFYIALIICLVVIAICFILLWIIGKHSTKKSALKVLDEGNR